jgi:hypothetical protein
VAGHRRPCPFGSDGEEAIDDGTLCLITTPAPGLTSHEHSLAHADHSLTQIATTESLSALQRLAITYLGQQSFGLGVIYGMGENVVDSVVSLAGIARIFVLADLYERATARGIVHYVGPLAVVQNLIADLSMNAFRQELEQAYAERNALVEEVTYAVKNPGDVFGEIKASYVQKWHQFETYSAQNTLSGQFQAGRIFGSVLMDVLALIGTGAALAKTAARIPRLLRLAKMPKRGAIVTVVEELPRTPKEAPMTPSQLKRAQEAPVVSEPTVEPKKAPAKKKSLREQYLGKTPGKDSKTGREVIERMRQEGKTRIDPISGDELFQAQNGNFYPLADMDMAHAPDAVKWWNETGRHYGAKSPEVRKWMLDSDNYVLDYYRDNRSAGALLTDRYLPPTR